MMSGYDEDPGPYPPLYREPPQRLIGLRLCAGLALVAGLASLVLIFGYNSQPAPVIQVQPVPVTVTAPAVELHPTINVTQPPEENVVRGTKPCQNHGNWYWCKEWH